MLYREKADQAQALLAETGLDCWLSFARETECRPDPGVELVVGADVVRSSAFLFDRSGARIAILARFDVANVQASGVFTEVIPFDADFRTPLRDALTRLDPKSIGLNYSRDDPTADGLTYGHLLRLTDALKDTPYPGRFTTAAPLLARLRGRKVPAEVARIREAIRETEDIVGLVGGQIRPGISARAIADVVHAEFRRRDFRPAWPADSCPVVDVGPGAESGHNRPSDEHRVAPGHAVHIDLGLKKDGYCSDLQRDWYVLKPGESRPPEEVTRAYATIVRAIEAAAAVLRPGAVGHEVDAAARQVVVDAGYPEFRHGVGHGLGRAVHDGGTLLGPKWPVYGTLVEGVVEAGNVFTLELGVQTSAGHVGLEEDVLVTPTGCEFLSSFPREIFVVGG
ncbi:MAG TPA: Xaa-Pro peptidase family protein [Gemmataceae bacterium]|nr:Xaa-Pro peptidase family protein [Gemmataceae bacterium]